MNKRISILVLLLMSLFFCSCSSKKNATVINSKDIVIPTHSNHMNEDFKNDKEKEEKYESLKRKHFHNQSRSTQIAMKENEKMSKKNTPIRKRKSSFFCRKKECVNKVDNNMIMDGVSDTRQ